MNLVNFITHLGQRARAAARVIARAPTAAKNDALEWIAGALERESEALQSASARGRIVYCIDGPSEAHRTHNRQNGRGAAANCSLARSGWRNPSFKAPAERYSSRTNACADWRHRHYLRSAA